MNKKSIETSIEIFAFVTIWFTILFDPTNLAVGSRLIDMPDFALLLATFLGNVLWIFGAFFLIISISLLIVVIFNKDDLEHTIRRGVLSQLIENKYDITPFNIRDENGKVLFRNLSLFDNMLMIISITGSFIAMGSGFWFFGPTWLLTIIVTYMYWNAGVNMANEIIKIEIVKDRRDL